MIVVARVKRENKMLHDSIAEKQNELDQLRILMKSKETEIARFQEKNAELAKEKIKAKNLESRFVHDVAGIQLSAKKELEQLEKQIGEMTKLSAVNAQ